MFVALACSRVLRPLAGIEAKAVAWAEVRNCLRAAYRFVFAESAQWQGETYLSFSKLLKSLRDHVISVHVTPLAVMLGLGVDADASATDANSRVAEALVSRDGPDGIFQVDPQAASESGSSSHERPRAADAITAVSVARSRLKVMLAVSQPIFDSLIFVSVCNLSFLATRFTPKVSSTVANASKSSKG
jgi:hypothetical protein